MTMVQADVAGGNKNYILQTADHTSPDYVLETKLSAWTLVGQFRQAGILVWQDDDNYVKFNAISDVDNTRINRIEIRSEVAGAIGQPAAASSTCPPGVTGDLAAADQVRAPTTQAEASFDGTTWQAVGARRHQRRPPTEVRPLHGRRRRRGRHRDLRLLQGQRLDGLRRRRDEHRRR